MFSNGVKRMRIRVSNSQDVKISLPKVRRLIKYVLAREGIKKTNIEISVLLVDNNKIKEINKEYLGRIGATDVICFCMWEGPFYKLHPELLGDVVISVEQAKKVALRLHKDFKIELWLYLIHGLLHLLGYKDDTKNNSKKMHKREQYILKGWLKYAGKN